MSLNVTKIEPGNTTRGITPTETYEIRDGDVPMLLVHKGDEAYFATDFDGKWLSTWYDTLVEAASAGMNKLEEKRFVDGL